MALRLNPEPISVSHEEHPEVLLARAEAALADARLDDYRSLFETAGRLADRHQRYRTHTGLLERGLGSAAALPDARVGELFVILATTVTELLEQDPREPVLLNYGGVAFYELGALRCAEQLFRAAARLDSDLPHVSRNLQQLRARRRATGDARVPLPARLRAALAAVERRAGACARRAQPAAGLTLSLCMIVRDEEEMLPRCLEAVAGAVDEIVVVDTGSTDRTIEIARSFGARVVEQPWTGSFAEARNRSFDEAGGDWILYLDADEVLVAEDAARLRELTGRVWREAFYLVETNFTGDLEDGTAVTHNALRLFRNRPEYRFEGRIHEQIAHRLPGGLPERIEATTIRMEHYGYLGHVRDAKEKSRRNVELLERQAAEGESSPFFHFNIGSEYAATGDAAAALRHFRAGWEMLAGDPDLGNYGFAPSLLSRLVKALRATGDLDGAGRRAEDGLAIFPGFTDLVFEQAQAAAAAGDHAAAIAKLERCLQMGDGPSRYTSMQGCGSYLALLELAAARRALGDLAGAEEVLSRCLDDHPAFLGCVLPLAATMLQRGAEPEAVATDVERRVRDVTPSVRFMLGTALYEAGATAEAERQFSGVLERQPASGAARAALAESLLSQGRYADAAEQAAAVAVDSACRPAALRTQATAALLAGDAEAAGRLLADGAGLPDDDRALFAAWLSRAQGEEGPSRLPAGSAELLTIVLEALLRLVEVDAFAQLVPLLERVGMPWRERRETLAAMYLRRGFLESAGDEWLGVCAEAGPDARALIGLAQVAYARGLSDDARVFAVEACALEPGHELAERLAARLAVAA